MIIPCKNRRMFPCAFYSGIACWFFGGECSHRLVFCFRDSDFFKRSGIMNETNRETRVAVISVIVEDAACVPAINDILHSSAAHIIGRMGIPYREKNINIISVAVDAAPDEISNISGRLGRLPGATVKTAYSKR